MNKAVRVCSNYNRNKIRLLWVNRVDVDSRAEIRRSLRKLKEIRDFGDVIQAF